MHIHEVLGWGLGVVSELGEAVMLLLLLLLLLLVTALPMHVVPWVRACSEGPKELFPALAESLLSPCCTVPAGSWGCCGGTGSRESQESA